jgi:DNA topoisomerase-2
MSRTPQKGKKYVKLEPREHVLTRPGMYIGSLEPDESNVWVFSDDCMVKKDIKYVSGLYKIFDEILVNVLDHIVRLSSSEETHKKVKEVRITIHEDGTITVYNDGEGIEVVKDEDYKMYAPELIFGNMLTSSNYDDDVEKIIGGQNGIGAKACNIFSKTFDIETVDSKRKKLYKQSFSNNMKDRNDPIIEKYTKYPFTKVTFKPDYEKFGMSNLSSDMLELFTKRVYDVCALTDQNIKVFYNDNKLEIKSFEKYVDLYIGSKNDHPRVYDGTNERWEIAASYSDCGFSQVSFVNGVCTQKGGKHVDFVVNQITKKLIDMVLKKKKISLKAQHLKDHLFIFIKSTITNPTFDSQTKDNLTTPSSKFGGTKLEIDIKFIEKLYKSGIVEKAISLTTIDEDKNAKKTDGKKQSTVRVNKLDDANWAGTSKSGQCYLILTEGDSAKTMAVSGLSEVGRDRYGVFPLKGKLMNVKDVKDPGKISNNEEISNLKKILGLENKKVYTDTNDLRYGHIILMTDADVDGSHIKGLVMNLFHTLWPSLCKIDGFITSIMTPIIKATKGNKTEKFYNLTEYGNWRNTTGNQSGWNVKYYKGLGTSTSKEAKEYFKDLNILTYDYEISKTDASLNLAFLGSMADERKTWIQNYDKERIISYDKETCNRVGYSTYVDSDLIHFSVYNAERAIPNICDGFKKSIRKIMYSCFKRKLHSEIKVAQLAGYVSEHGAYHHGEASLQDAIIGMAQNYVGSNNINMLMPNGQFGSRIHGGHDNASPRYIFTCLNPIVKYIFKEDDLDILTYLEEDGTTIEPEFYVPIIPTILVNGAVGIGTGYSTNIPCYNPVDIISNLKLMINDEEPLEISPWYRGFTGTNTKKESKGVYKRLSGTKLEVTELPVQIWTECFKTYLDEYIEKQEDSKKDDKDDKKKQNVKKKVKTLKDYESHYTETTVKFILQFHSTAILDDMLAPLDTEGGAGNKFEKEFKMTNSRPINTNNMHLFDSTGVIRKYRNPNEILAEFYTVRLDYYDKRKINKLQKYEKDLLFLDSKVKFILDIIDEKLKYAGQLKSGIEAYLEHNKFPKIDDKYDYLTHMPLINCTYEKKELLLKEYNDKNAQYENYKALTIKALWKQDLDELENYLKNAHYIK